MADTTATVGSMTAHWVVVTDVDGRRRMEMRWSPDLTGAFTRAVTVTGNMVGHAA